MWSIAVALGVFATCLADNVPPADRVIFRDGEEVLGQVVEPSPRGIVRFVVRRAWAEEHCPEQLPAWERDEAARQELARRQRRDRLMAWAAERQTGLGALERDRIGRWITSELANLSQPTAPKTSLVVVDLDARSIHQVERRSEISRLLLRQAWRTKVIEEPETRSVDELSRLLEGRGVVVSGEDPALIDDLVGPLPESDASWMTRRAATEVQNDTGLRFVKYGELLLPEATDRLDPIAAGRMARSLIAGLIDDPATAKLDPLADQMRIVERQGQAGVIVTELEIASDLSGVTVVATLWVRESPGRWVPRLRRPARCRIAEVPDEDVAAVAAAPSVDRVLKLFELLGGGSNAEGQRLGVRIGAATRRALGDATSALQREMEAIALPIH